MADRSKHICPDGQKSLSLPKAVSATFAKRLYYMTRAVLLIDAAKGG